MTNSSRWTAPTGGRPGAWQAECDRSQAAAADKDLDYQGSCRGQAAVASLDLPHMTEEYARHNGHADLIRELLDGAAGR